MMGRVLQRTTTNGTGTGTAGTTVTRRWFIPWVRSRTSLAVASHLPGHIQGWWR